MSFTTNIEKAKGRLTTFVRIRPRRRLLGWVEDVGNPDVWRKSWAHGFNGLFYNSAYVYVDAAASEADCIATENSVFYDEENAEIIFHAPASPNIYFTVVEWDIYLCTEDQNWYKDPKNNASGDAHWHGGLVRAPSPSQGNADLIFGYSPVSITSLQVQVADGFLFEHLHEWSLNGSQIKVWVLAGELRTENISELFVGVGGSLQMQGGVLSIQVQDPLKLLDAEWDGDYFSGNDFSGLNPDDEGLPIREVFGFMRTFLPVNIDYNATASTSNNRDWVVRKGTLATSPVLSTLIQHLSGDNNAFQTKVADASYFAAGDKIIVLNNGTPKYAICAGTDLALGLVFHTDVGSRSPVVTDTVRRGFISQLNVNLSVDIGGGVFVPQTYELYYGRDWTEHDFANGTVGFTLADNFETNFSFPDGIFNPANHQIFAAVYGGSQLPKKLNGIDDFGARAARGGAAGHPVTILWDILRNRIRTFREVAALDESAWSDLALAFDRTIGIAVPETKAGDFPTFKDVAQLLLQTELLRTHFKVEEGFGLLTLTQTAPASGAADAASEIELIDPSYSWDYSDVYSAVQLDLNLGELQTAVRTLDVDTVYIYPDATVELSPMRAGAYLHRVSKTFQMRSLFAFAFENESDLVAMRLAKIVGERRGTLSGSLPVSFLHKTIDDKLPTELERQPGFELEQGVSNERDYKLARHQKSAAGVAIVLDDQKGIQDSSRW